uniref:GPI inositol-deacylase n=1 Tax=Globisporangium ultimum (strain ATCC 200006 / CBS 805.95 / DAOM BR144) TaxID=431595 RepID=K3X275_GLOUD
MARVLLHGVFLPLVALLSVALSGVYVFDLWRTSHLPSGCKMTYSWPVYTPLAWSKATSTHHKYQLYRVHMKQYREELTGVPVLFIPGHLGSYKQARSIARHLWDAQPNLFDVFAVEFQEELSGMNGKFVHHEAQYVNDAIRAILRQYKKQQQSALKKHKGKASSRDTKTRPFARVPDSVVIVAHSMGGIVARMAETLPNYKTNSIQHVVSFGSPYHKLPFPFDTDMQSVYATITHDAFAKEQKNDTEMPVYVSIAGGHKDTIIHASLSITDRILPQTHSVASLTTAMPSVQFTMGHLSLLWCHQLLDRVTKSLIAVVDLDTRDLVKDSAMRVETSRTILLSGNDNDGDEGEEVVLHEEVEEEVMNALPALDHREHLLDGYYTDEFAKYGLQLPKVIFHVLRTSYAVVFVIMYALTLHILSLQVAHWQGCFGLPDAQQLTASSSTQDKFPSFMSMLHPIAHTPPVIKNVLTALTHNIDGSRNTAAIAVLSAVGLGGLGFLIESGRRNPQLIVRYGFVLELGFLYVFAIGLMYAISSILSLLHTLVVARIVTALHKAVAQYKVQRWMIIGSIFVAVFVLGHIESLAPFKLVPSTDGDSSRNLALLVLASFVVLVVYLVALGGNATTSIDQQRVQRSLFALYLLSLMPWVGKIAYFASIVRFPPPQLTNDLLLEGGACIVLLALTRYLVTLTQEWMLPLPPTAFFGSATGQDAGSAYDGNSGNDSTGTKKEITAENCPRCVFEDGGPGAIFVEYTNESTKRIKGKNNDVVIIGPTFRVVSCDCVVRLASTPRKFCDFCTRSCRLCGGGSGNYQQAHQYREFVQEKQTQVALHALVPFALELLAMVQISPYGLTREHIPFYLTPLCTIALLVYHLALLSPVEAKRRKNKLKPKKKKRKSKTKATTGGSSSASSPSTTTSSKQSTTASTSYSSTNGKSIDKPTTTAKSNKKKSNNDSKDSAKDSIWVNPIYELADPSE